MRIAFRVDASVEIGTGHVMRCLTLADALRSHGVESEFICRPHRGHLGALVQSRGHCLRWLPQASTASSEGEEGEVLAHSSWLGCSWRQDAEDTLAVLKQRRPDWLIIDHYAIDIRWERMARPLCGSLMVIDDLADRHHDADVLLDQNWHGDAQACRYRALVPGRCRTLLGPRYALLSSEYQLLRNLMPPRDGVVKRVLLFFGGGDPSNVTGKVLDALCRPEFGHLALDIVLGVNHPCPDTIRVQAAHRGEAVVHQGLPSLAGLMCRADLMISAGGSTSWERMCLGLPGVVIAVADNQVGANEALSWAGYISFLGHLDDLQMQVLMQSVMEAIKSGERLREQSRRCQALVPGDGAERVFCALLNADS
ncbi:UDP-2,4-diacetamido-2,4,6-trideoxy-beta-L-altropyranose hydrolase [Allopusillimonas soli]|uniref:UDP-2,4-diacetamido-2,4, 6-trideoxy-beta-L-altropyranose hydrolase n=1 Tax=Allopusillimonas soli TaxID=659016 RepID=A0A853FDK7_9BURK|nr:UDP-2,4-diacetamido-2,4,6-trideoxy-beta-L-altropyranose hydrolase [Allopusillimonas soli]NYT38017.1 UDP-2,4-diacetamido-2,4,6-trideoxy-beta-L-altropyranose hydrolase [Allopusillimonas soli]TEA73910.1 UDP-2,4-diacetamido-2,4,6-trideoxy-beta-L-altropyranose hydrolase [Allopusillimonas soli]